MCPKRRWKISPRKISLFAYVKCGSRTQPPRFSAGAARWYGWQAKSSPLLKSPYKADTTLPSALVRSADGKVVLKFNLLDKIESITAERLTARKQVSLAEEYLADHFPTFPVLPGVMMLEAMTQACGWLLHHRGGFACSMTILKEAKNVKYAHFLSPGQSLVVDVQWVKSTDAGAIFKAAGTVDEQPAVTARLELAYFNLAQRDSAYAPTDAALIEHHKRRWQLLNLQNREQSL